MRSLYLVLPLNAGNKNFCNLLLVCSWSIMEKKLLMSILYISSMTALFAHSHCCDIGNVLRNDTIIRIIVYLKEQLYSDNCILDIYCLSFLSGWFFRRLKITHILVSLKIFCGRLKIYIEYTDEKCFLVQCPKFYAWFGHCCPCQHVLHLIVIHYCSKMFWQLN